MYKPPTHTPWAPGARNLGPNLGSLLGPRAQTKKIKVAGRKTMQKICLGFGNGGIWSKLWPKTDFGLGTRYMGPGTRDQDQATRTRTRDQGPGTWTRDQGQGQGPGTRTRTRDHGPWTRGRDQDQDHGPGTKSINGRHSMNRIQSFLGPGHERKKKTENPKGPNFSKI